MRIPESELPVFFRLYIDQLYPIGGRVLANPINRSEQGVQLAMAGKIQYPASLVEEMETGDSADEKITEEQEKEARKKETEVPSPGLATIPTRRNEFPATLSAAPDRASCIKGPMEVEIVGYDHTKEPPIALVSPILQPEPFELFKQHHKVHTDVKVEVMGLLSIRTTGTHQRLSFVNQNPVWKSSWSLAK